MAAESCERRSADSDKAPLARRLLWFVALWAAGVLAVLAVAAAMRLALGL